MNKTMQNKVTELPMADSLITEATEKTARTPVRVSGFDLEEIGQQAGKEILLQGSVYKLRRMSGFAFVLLRTGRHVIRLNSSSLSLIALTAITAVPEAIFLYSS